MVKTKGKDHTKVCWSCGKETMEPDERGYRCRSCGATWNKIPEPGHASLVVAPNPGAGGTRGRAWGAPD